MNDILITCRIFLGFVFCCCVSGTRFGRRGRTRSAESGFQRGAVECSHTVFISAVPPTFPANGELIRICSVQLSSNQTSVTVITDAAYRAVGQ